MVLEIILWIIRFFFGAGIFSFLHIVIDKLTVREKRNMCKEQEDCKIFLSGINRWSIHDRLCDCIWLRENGCDFSKEAQFFLYIWEYCL